MEDRGAEAPSNNQYLRDRAMSRQVDKEVRIQRDYYARTAHRYDEMHVAEYDEHYRAMRLMFSFFDDLGCRSVLDIGAGTGRLVQEVKRRFPHVRVVGVEPSPELRMQAQQKGVSPEDLIDGDGQALHFGNEEFDIVCEFGTLHHVPDPRAVVSEMLRVARKAIFISDSNNFGHGSALSRAVKQGLNSLSLWPLADWIKNGGKRYHISEGDGLAYSYSVFTDYDYISRHCSEILLLNTMGKAVNLYRAAPHVALLGLKHEAAMTGEGH